MNTLMDALVDAAEEIDWAVHIEDDCIEFEKYSPAGRISSSPSSGTTKGR